MCGHKSKLNWEYPNNRGSKNKHQNERLPSFLRDPSLWISSLLFLVYHFIIENVMPQISENFKCPITLKFFTQEICDWQKIVFTKFFNLIIKSMHQWAPHP